MCSLVFLEMSKGYDLVGQSSYATMLPLNVIKCKKLFLLTYTKSTRVLRVPLER